MRRSLGDAIWILAAVALAPHSQAHAQHTPIEAATPAASTAPHRTRLFLKDGSFQVVMSYKVTGDRVQIVSAERAGQTEEIPLDLVDLAATKQWEQQHAPASEGDADARPAPQIDPELAKEEADRAALAPEVAPNLHLAPEDNVLVLDTWHGTPELVPLTQSAGDLNQTTGHSILKGIISPRSAPHQMVELKGEQAAVQLHVPDPVIYIRLDDAMPSSGEVLTVDTHGATTEKDKQRPTEPNDYVIVQVDVRQDARIVASFSTDKLGTTEKQQNLIETDTTVLPGGHWAKIVPRGQLLIGEYCLVEVLGRNQINLGVWDFGVHPRAPENRDVIQPEVKRRAGLEKRPRSEAPQ